jgi:hypothetical protein
MNGKERTNITLSRKLTREELQFLPAALEIIETPPSPVGRIMIWLLIFSVCDYYNVVCRG